MAWSPPVGGRLVDVADVVAHLGVVGGLVPLTLAVLLAVPVGMAVVGVGLGWPRC